VLGTHMGPCVDLHQTDKLTNTRLYEWTTYPDNQVE